MIRQWKARLSLRYSIWRAKRRGLLYEQREERKRREAILARQRIALELAEQVLAERRRADEERITQILIDVWNDDEINEQLGYSQADPERAA